MGTRIKSTNMLVALCVGLLAITFTTDASAGFNPFPNKKRQAASASNEKEAKAYCESEKKKGNECYVRRAGKVLASCKKGWTRGETFRGKGKDYATCKRSKRHMASVANKKQAEDYCAKKKKAGTECKVMKGGTIKGCGKDWSKAQTFRGKGKDYLACTRSSRYKASQENKSEANAYCKSAKAKGRECIVKKSNVMGCGNGWTKVQKFNGKGKDYIACERSKRHLGSKKNKSDAEKYCDTARKKGQQCKVIRANVLGCGGKKWRRGKKFKGKGKDYLTCIRNNVWEINVKFVIAGKGRSKKEQDALQAWLKNEARQAEKLYTSSPALVIDESFTYVDSRGGKSLKHIKFRSGKAFHKYMDDHFDIVAQSKTSGYMNVLVTESLTVDKRVFGFKTKTSTPGGKATFPHSVDPFGRKHGPAIVIPRDLPIEGDSNKACGRNYKSTFAHELGHIFGLKHSFEPYVMGRCNKGYKKWDKGKGGTLKSDGTINLMDYERREANGCPRETYLNDCQNKRAARKRKQWMTRDGKVKYKRVRGAR